MLTSAAHNTVETHIKDKKLFRQQCYVGGSWVAAEDGAVFSVNNPADGSELGTVPGFGVLDTHRAIAAAEAA